MKLMIGVPSLSSACCLADSRHALPQVEGQRRLRQLAEQQAALTASELEAEQQRLAARLQVGEPPLLLVSCLDMHASHCLSCCRAST
jgi:hypothetical protein